MLKPASLLLALIVIASALIAQSNLNNSNPKQAPPPRKEASEATQQAPPAAQPIKPTQSVQAVTGKNGQSAYSINTSTTSSVGVETPGVQTDNGMAQQPDKYRNVNPVNPPQRRGAPPNWEQVGQDEQLANSNAAAAARAEIGGPEGTLGVGNALPSYARGGKPTASSQTNTNQAKPGQTNKNASGTGSGSRTPQ